jgi:hypothetical protein
MAADILAGSIVDVQLTASTGLTSTPDSVLQQVSGVLASGGQLTSVGPSILNGSTSGIALSTLLSLSSDQPFQADFPVLTQCEFAAQGDVASIVANAFYQVTGNYPTSVNVVSVTPPSGVTVPASAPPLSASGVGGSTSGGGAVTTSIQNGLASLGSAGTSLLIGLAAIIILVLVLVAYGPNVGKIASAAL